MLVLFGSQQVVAALLYDGLGDGRLATDRIDRHNTIAQVQQPQQRGNRRDFIRFGADFCLGQHQLLCFRPDADHMDGVLVVAMVMRTTHFLAIDTEGFALRQVTDGAHPTQKTVSKGLRVDPCEHAPEGVM